MSDVDFAKKLLGNRILDLYLKYTALKTLNSATMVPIAFIMGRDYLKKKEKKPSSARVIKSPAQG